MVIGEIELHNKVSEEKLAVVDGIKVSLCTYMNFIGLPLNLEFLFKLQNLMARKRFSWLL